MLPTSVNEALSVEPVSATSVYVTVSPASGSVVKNVPMTVPIGRFSATGFPGVNLGSVGGSLTFVTITTIVFVAVSGPSLTRTTRS